MLDEWPDGKMMSPCSTDGSPVSVCERPMRIFIAPTTTLRTRNDIAASTTGRQVRFFRAK
jgi:hypothetical protein